MYGTMRKNSTNILYTASLLYRVDTHLLLELIVGVDTVDLPGFSKQSTKGEGESKSEHPEAKLQT